MITFIMQFEFDVQLFVMQLFTPSGSLPRVLSTRGCSIMQTALAAKLP